MYHRFARSFSVDINFWNVCVHISWIKINTAGNFQTNVCLEFIKKKKNWDCKQSKFHYIFTVSFTASIYRMAIWTSAYLPAAWTIHLWRTRTGAVLSKITIWTSYMEKMCLIKYLYINKILIILIFMFLAKIITYM